MYIVKTIDNHTYRAEKIGNVFFVERPRCAIIIRAKEVVSYCSLSPEDGETVTRRRTRKANSYFNCTTKA